MANGTTAAESEVMRVLEARSQAISAKDLAALRRCYVDDVRVFDLGTQVNSFDELGALWDACFPDFQNPISTERKDLHLSVGSDMAVATFLSRLTAMASDHPSAKSWLRTTVCLKKLGEDWKIIHDHVSLPVDCGAETPTYILDDA